MTAVDQSGWVGRKAYIRLPSGRSLAFVDTGGSGPVLVLLHGYSDTGRSFSLMQPWLQGWRLLVPDLPGHGGSDGRGDMRIESLADDVAGFIEALDVETFAVVGHSMGAMVAIALAARPGSGVTALATISGAVQPEFSADGAVARGILALADPIDPAASFFDEWHACARPVDLAFLALARVEAAAMPSGIWRSVLKAFETTDLSGAARQVRVPVLCIAGAADPLFGPQHRSALARALSPGRSVVLDDHGHNPHWEDPARIAGLLTAFLDDTLQPRAATLRPA